MKTGLHSFILLSLFSTTVAAWNPGTTCVPDHLKVALVPVGMSFISSEVRIHSVERAILDDNFLLSPRNRFSTKIDRTAEAGELWKRSGIRFEENRGQIVDTDGRQRPEIRFTAEAQGVKLFFMPDGVSSVFVHLEANEPRVSEATGRGVVDPLAESELGNAESTLYRMDMKLAGCNMHAKIRALSELPGYANYYLGHCPDGITHVKSFARIVYENVYDNIDLEYFESGGRLKYNFLVRPGGKVDDIRMLYAGGTARIGEDGRLHVHTPLGSITEDAPVTYSIQEGTSAFEASGIRIASRFRQDGDGIGIEVDAYDHSTLLVIDPWATYVGGLLRDEARGVASDANGNLYVGGSTRSLNFPVTNSSTFGGGNYDDAFAAKFDSGGNLVWATYYGGSDDDSGFGLATDGGGNAILTGWSKSTNFPVTNTSTNAGQYDAFVAKFNSSGVVQWATLYGGSAADISQGVATDGNGNIVIAGGTSSPNFPVTNASTFSGNNDILIVQFSSSGSVNWATMYGGTALDAAWAVATDGNGNCVIAGYSNSTNIPVTNSSTPAGGHDTFVMKFDGTGALLWAILYGGSGPDLCYGMAVDGNGDVYAAGKTDSNFPVTTSVPYAGGSSDAFIVKFNGSGVVQWATFTGGDGEDLAYAVAADVNGNVAVTGSTDSVNFPVTTSQFKSAWADVFVIVCNSSGSVQWSTLHGGNNNDNGRAVTFAGNGSVAVVGSTWSTDFPVTISSIGYGGNLEGFVIHFGSNGSTPVQLASFNAARHPSGGVLLQWRTETETNLFGFEIQRSSGGTWETVAIIPGAGTSNQPHDYSYSDDAAPRRALGERLKYRLRQVDVDGSDTFSPVIEVSDGGRLEEVELLSVYPHPAKDECWLTMKTAIAQRLAVSLHDMNGRIVRRLIEDVAVSAGTHVFAVRLAALAPGLYHLIVSGDAATMIRTIVLEN